MCKPTPALVTWRGLGCITLLLEHEYSLQLSWLSVAKTILHAHQRWVEEIEAEYITLGSLLITHRTADISKPQNTAHVDHCLYGYEYLNCVCLSSIRHGWVCLFLHMPGLPAHLGKQTLKRMTLYISVHASTMSKVYGHLSQTEFNMSDTDFVFTRYICRL